MSMTFVTSPVPVFGISLDSFVMYLSNGKSYLRAVYILAVQKYLLRMIVIPDLLKVRGWCQKVIPKLYCAY